MNLNESVNKWLDKMDSNKKSLITEGVGSNIFKILKTILKLVHLPKFSTESLKKWISDHADEFEKAHTMYTKALTMRESTMNEGILDMFKGMNKNTLIMFVLIAISGLAGSASAVTKDDVAAEIQAFIMSNVNSQTGSDVDFPDFPADIQRQMDSLDALPTNKSTDVVIPADMQRQMDSIDALPKRDAFERFNEPGLKKLENKMNAAHNIKELENAAGSIARYLDKSIADETKKLETYRGKSITDPSTLVDRIQAARDFSKLTSPENAARKYGVDIKYVK